MVVNDDSEDEIEEIFWSMVGLTLNSPILVQPLFDYFDEITEKIEL